MRACVCVCSRYIDNIRTVAKTLVDLKAYRMQTKHLKYTYAHAL